MVDSKKSENDAFEKFEKKNEEGLGSRPAGKNAAVDNANVWDEEENGEENAPLSRDQWVAVAKAMPDGCDNMVAQIRAESEAFLKKDSQESKCGRSRCKNKGKCFIHRRKLHNEGKSLYSIVKCKVEKERPPKENPKKTPKKSESAAEGAAKDSMCPHQQQRTQ